MKDRADHPSHHTLSTLSLSRRATWRRFSTPTYRSTHTNPPTLTPYHSFSESPQRRGLPAHGGAHAGAQGLDEHGVGAR